MDAWRGAGGGAPTSGHLRLVAPGAGGSSTAGGDAAVKAENQALKARVTELQGKLTDTQRLLEIRNNELAALQKKLSVSTPGGSPAVPVAAPPAPLAKAPAAAAPPAVTKPAPAATPPETSAPTPLPPPAAVHKPALPTAAGPDSWIDWIAANWWLPAAVIAALIAALAFAAWRRRRGSDGQFAGLDATDIQAYREPGKPAEGEHAFVVEESSEQPQLGALDEHEHVGEATQDLSKASDDTISSESAVNLDQGDPMAEADFHMAYGLYDQAADLVRIALEREPERRDLRMKLLEIYFVWGNKDQFLQTAKTLEATRDRAPAGEWDKIVIMGKQICPDEPLFKSAPGGGRGAGDVVDLNLEGGENRVDIDLFGDPEGEHSADRGTSEHFGKAGDSGEATQLNAGSDLDFTFDSPERGADESPTREMPPRDEPTVESELMSYTDTDTREATPLLDDDLRDRFSSRLSPPKVDQTAEVSIDDLGLDLDHLEQSGPPTHSPLEITGHPTDAPTMVAGLDEKSRRMMAEAESRAREQEMTQLERELEASFVADLGPEIADSKTEVLGPESAPTVLIARGNEVDAAATSRFKSMPNLQDSDRFDAESTSRLRNLSPSDSIDLDLDKLASALGSGDTVEQPPAEEAVFSNEVFEGTKRTGGLDLDVGDAFEDSMSGAESPTNKLAAVATRTRSVTEELPELEPVTMSEVGTKLDLARAYMDMGDPEGARSILEEVVSEGSASQKQEAQRLIEALPG